MARTRREEVVIKSAIASARGEPPPIAVERDGGGGWELYAVSGLVNANSFAGGEGRGP